MKHLFLALLILTFASVAQGQTVVEKGKAFQAVWDYSSADLIAQKVVKFEVSIDSGAFFNANLPIVAPVFVYAMPTGLAVGQHAVSVRSCSITTCSDEVSVLFEVVAPVVIVKPNPPTNFRLNVPKPPPSL